jgi:protein-tyrosine phosphatase
MLKKVPIAIVSVLLFSFCTHEKPDIRVVCASDPYLGICRIKWETFPLISGTVKIYESSQPDSFNLYSPLVEANIEDGYKDVFSLRTLNRSYYKLVFNNDYSIVTSERKIALQGPFNFRDIGGYYGENNRQVRWGRLYRSSSLSRLTRQDARVMENLKIKTVIDFRTESERFKDPYRFTAPRLFSLPLRGNPNPVPLFLDQILREKITARDIITYKSEVNSFLLENNADYYRQMFDILADRANYPAVMNCILGNDRTGIAAALVLFALGVDWNQTLDDWALSDDMIDYNSIDFNWALYPDRVLETVTGIYRSPRETIIGPFEKIAKEYGSIDKFLETECGLTSEKRDRLREILLYP